MNRVEHAICRIRERLPQQDGYVTLGVGCVVKHEELATSLGWKCSNLLVTSADVLSPQHLSSDRTVTAEFLVFEKKGLEVFELKAAAEFCQTISGRNLNEQDGSLPNEQLTVLSVEPLDKRGFLKRMVKKSSLQTTRPIDCFDFHNYNNEIDDGIFCNVIREFGSNGQEFESRTYKFKFNKSRNVYMLEDFLRRDVELEEQSFPSDQVLAGGVVFSKQGLYLGCLTFNAGQIVPSFIPDAYLQLQAEETPDEGQQEEYEAEGIDLDSRKDDPIDENENEELMDKNVNEQASRGENETCQEELGQPELPDKDEVGSQGSNQQTEPENVEDEDTERISQDGNEEPEKNSEEPQLGFDKSKRDSTELEFIVAVDSIEKEESENINEKSTPSTSENEDNVVSNTEVETPQQNENQERISSEIEIEETDEQICTKDQSQSEPEDINEQEQTDILVDNTLYKENDISTLNTEHSEGIAVNDHDNVPMETDTEIKNGDVVLEDTSEKSVEAEETKKYQESEDVIVPEPCLPEEVMTDNEVSQGIDSSVIDDSRDIDSPGIDSPVIDDSPGIDDSLGIESPGIDSQGIDSPGIDDSPVIDSQGISSQDIDGSPVIDDSPDIDSPVIASQDIDGSPVIDDSPDIDSPVIASQHIDDSPVIASQDIDDSPVIVSQDIDGSPVIDDSLVIDSQAIDSPGTDSQSMDKNTLETTELDQQNEVETEEQKTLSDTSLQDDIPLDNKPTEEISPEDEETIVTKQDEVEVEEHSPPSTNTEGTQGHSVIEKDTLDENQISSEVSQKDEISEQSSPQDNLEIHQEGEGSEPRSHQDEILVNQEEIMSVDAGKHLVETQNEVKTDVFKLDKPVKPEEAGEPLEPDDLLMVKITNNPKALDDLAILLDTEYQHGGVSSWYDLAELLAIPKEAYDHCLSFSKPSPTEDLLVFLSSTKPQFSISDLKDSLRSISRPDVVHIVDRYIARAVISDGTVIQGVIEREDIDLLGELALKLDRGHQSNWKVLARQLEVPSRIFRNFGSHQRQNSALLMLKYLPIFDPDLTVDSLKDSCRTVGLEDLVKFLDASGVPGEDAIMDILEDTDFIGELTDILNEEDEHGPNWKKLGRELKIPEEKFSIFEPQSMNSPTKMLLQSIAKCEPDITVDELILALVAMKRHDIIEMMGKHFRNSDIRSILEENNCLPPESPHPEDTIKEEEEEESTA